MKLFVLIGILALQVASAADIKLPEYDWTLTDISSKELDRQGVFESMDTDDIKLGSSICSNRALLWTYEMKKKLDLNTAKIFVFYTGKVGDVGRKKWWYHVAPVINEGGKLYVADPGFEQDITGPQPKTEWLKTFAGTSNCYEIKNGDSDLIRLMYEERWFPRSTSHGHYTCYYKIVPGTYWTPGSVAENLLGIDDEGKRVRSTDRSRYQREELQQACEEATTGKFGRWFSDAKNYCEKRIGRWR